MRKHRLIPIDTNTVRQVVSTYGSTLHPALFLFLLPASMHRLSRHKNCLTSLPSQKYPALLVISANCLSVDDFVSDFTKIVCPSTSALASEFSVRDRRRSKFHALQSNRLSGACISASSLFSTRVDFGFHYLFNDRSDRCCRRHRIGISVVISWIEVKADSRE